MGTDLIEPVFSARAGVLRQARELLERGGIPSRHTSPGKDDGVLRVRRGDAGRAREILAGWKRGKGDVIGADEAAYFFCPACQSPLSLGASHCPECGEYVGDPHGR